MNLTIPNKEEFIDTFIGNLARVSDTGVLECVNDTISCKTKAGDDTVIIHSVIKIPTVFTEPVKLNIPDFKKLQKLLSTTTDADLELVCDRNSISYKGKSVRFKFHLYDDGVISIPRINIEKLNSVPFDSTFTVNGSSLAQLMKGSCMLMDVPKFYLSSEGNIVRGEIADHARDNVDSFCCEVSTDFTGKQLEGKVPLNIEFLKLVSTLKTSMFKVRCASSLNVFAFDIQTSCINTTYIVTALRS